MLCAGKPLKLLSYVYCKESSNDSGVLVKLADLEISAVMDQEGFIGSRPPLVILHLRLSNTWEKTEKVSKWNVVESVHSLCIYVG